MLTAVSQSQGSNWAHSGVEDVVKRLAASLRVTHDLRLTNGKLRKCPDGRTTCQSPEVKMAGGVWEVTGSGITTGGYQAESAEQQRQRATFATKILTLSCVFCCWEVLHTIDVKLWLKGHILLLCRPKSAMQNHLRAGLAIFPHSHDHCTNPRMLCWYFRSLNESVDEGHCYFDFNI